MNHFVSINSLGGYFGNFYWRNTDVSDSDCWGQIFSIPAKNILNTGWAGSVWTVRASFSCNPNN